MIRTPPQHQIDPAKKPGVIENPITSDPDKAPGQIKTLNDYIKQKEQAYMTSTEALDHYLNKEYPITKRTHHHLLHMRAGAEKAWHAAIEWCGKNTT